MESIKIVGGYFSKFHDGHKKYIEDAAKDCDKLIILVQDQRRQFDKYGYIGDSVDVIISNIKNWWFDLEMNKKPSMEIRVNHAKDISSSLEKIRNDFGDTEIITLVKDADRPLGNLPEEEREALIRLNIGYKHLGNPKIASSSEILGIKR